MRRTISVTPVTQSAAQQIPQASRCSQLEETSWSLDVPDFMQAQVRRDHACRNDNLNSAVRVLVCQLKHSLSEAFYQRSIVAIAGIISLLQCGVPWENARPAISVR